jgi:hypothetical protein
VCRIPDLKKTGLKDLLIGLSGQGFVLLADYDVGIVQLFFDVFKAPKDSGHNLNFPWETRVLPYGNNLCHRKAYGY